MFWKCAILKSDINLFTAWVYLLASIFYASSYTIFTEFIVINLYEVDYSKYFLLFFWCINMIFALIALVNFSHGLRTGVYWKMLIAPNFDFFKENN